MKKLFGAWLFCVGFALVLYVGCAFAYNGPFEFGSKVISGDADEGRLLYSFNKTPVIAYWDVGPIAGVFDLRDIIYLHIDTSVANTQINDIRLTKYGNHPPGSKIDDIDNDIDKLLKPFPAGSSIVFIDRSGNIGTNIEYNLGDQVYFHVNSLPLDKINEGDIRLSSFGNIAAGTLVDDSDPDLGLDAIPLPQNAIRFYNANGNEDQYGTPIYDAPDTIYIDISLENTSPMGFVVANDVRLSM